MLEARAFDDGTLLARGGFMSYLARLMLTTLAIFLFGCAIWANVANAPLSEMRGAWLSQAMRGMIY